MHDSFFAMKTLGNIYTLTNIIFSYKKRLCNFCFFNKLFTHFKEIKFINLYISVLFNHLQICLLEAHAFPKGLSSKVNVIARVEFEHAYLEASVQRFHHYAISVGRCDILNGNKEKEYMKRVYFHLIKKSLAPSPESVKIIQSRSALNQERAKFLTGKPK